MIGIVDVQTGRILNHKNERHYIPQVEDLLEVVDSHAKLNIERQH